MRRAISLNPWSRGRAVATIAGLLVASPPAMADAPAPVAPCQETASAIYERVSPTVVSIVAMSFNSVDVENRFDRVVGSGVLIDPQGVVLTNSHVVFGRQVVSVTLDDGSVLAAQIIGADPLFDVALIRISPPAGTTLRAAHFGNSDRIKVGEDVYAIGNPFGLEQTLSRGVVSGVNRLLPGVPLSLAEPMIQTDASINPGSSGGPLVDRCGDVIGITTSILADAQNIGFAVPINLINSIVPHLITDGRVVRPWFGVQGQLVTGPLKEIFRLPLVDGFLVEGIEPGSPAESRGILGGRLQVVVDAEPVLLGGDIITHIDGAPVDDFEKLGRALGAFKVGATIHVALMRDGQRLELDCTLTERPLLPLDIPDKRTTAPVASTGSRARFVLGLRDARMRF